MELNGIFKSSLIMTKVFKFWAQIENFVKENLCIPEMTGFLLVFCLFYFPTQVIFIILLVNTSNKSEI